MKKKICILYTGGTIGMVKTEKGFLPSSDFIKNKIANMPQLYVSEMPHFEIIQLENIFDSAEITVDKWYEIALVIQKQYLSYDAFVILHGTDTMAYTASALSFIIENLQKTIIITGSQIPISQIRSDGYRNIIDSIYIAANCNISEICIYFNNKLYRGNRATKICTDSFDPFLSPNFPCLLEAGLDIKVSDKAMIASDNNSENIKISKIKAQKINMLYMYPSMPISLIQQIIESDIKAAIFLTFGKGNAFINKKIIEIFKEASKREIMIINLSQCLKGKVDMEKYATGHAAAQLGMVSAKDMTKEATLTKLHYLLSQNMNFQDLKKYFQKSLKGEITDN